MLLCLPVWALADCVVQQPPAHVLTAAALPDAPSDRSDDARTPDSRWDAPPASSVGLQGTPWTDPTRLPAVEVPGLSHLDDPGRAAHVRAAARYPSPSRAPHLHDIPLLI
jgi:hypothetical protein